MKTYTRIALVLTILAMGVSSHAQTCTTPITGWQGQYTFSVAGSVTAPSGFQWTVDESVTAPVNAVLAGTPSCTMAGWIGQTSVFTISVNDKGSRSCAPSPGSERITVTGSTPVTSASNITIDLGKGTYTYFPASALTVTINSVNCSGIASKTIVPYPVYPASWLGVTFPLPVSPQPLTKSMDTFSALWAFGGATMLWNLSFTLDPVYSADDPCQQPGHSSIGCQDQSLGEDVPIVGTGFKLHYESSRSSATGGNTIANSDAAMIGGWTLSAHHAYDPTGKTLFLGDGSQRNAYQLGAPVTFNGNLLVTSEDGSEVYVFSGSTGQHLQTLRPLTGAIEFQFAYDVAGKLVTITDVSGNVTMIHRDATEHPTAIVSPYGQTTTLKTDSNGLLSQVTDPFGKSATFVNANTGLLTSRTDENGNVFHYTYDGQGRLAKDADPLGGFTSLTDTRAASGFGWSVGETTSTGRTSSYQTTLTAPWVLTSTSTFSNHHTNTWPNGLHATESKTQKGSQVSGSVALPDGTSSSDTLSPDPIWGIQVPVVTSETLTQGNLTMNITGSRAASLGTVGNPFSLTSQTDKTTINGRTYTSGFTASNRMIVDTTPAGRKITTALDSKERIASVQVGALLASDLAYDSRGRLSTVTQGTRTTTLTYDTDGRLATATDPLGLKNSFSYDADGRLLSTTLADGRIIDYKYDANGNLTALIPPGKSAHNFDYTAVNLMSEYLPPSVVGTGSTIYTYNTDQDLTKITRPDGETLVFDYDIAGRLISVITPSETVNYTYSSTTGNVTGASVASGEALSYAYDGPLPITTTWTGTVNGSVGLAYNNNFWVTSETINGGNTIAFSHDNDGLLINAGALTLTRNSLDGLITGTSLGLATDSRTYDSFGELTGYTASYKGAAVYNVTYTRDADGRVSSETETIAAHTNTYAYSYDSAGHLIGVSKNGTPISSYSYDTNSNRTKATTSAGTLAATYDAQDRLLTYGTASYTYTANGELASQTVGTQKTAYQYDVLGNLVSVALPSGKTISYVVDAENRRVGKKVNGVLSEGFLYDEDRVVAQLNGSNAIVSQFIYAGGATSPDYMVSGGVTYRIFFDQLGSPRLVVNTSTVATAEQISYDEFGNVISDTNPGFQPFGFAGGLYDQDTKLVRFGARDYNPIVGRWTAKDPILFDGEDSNLYGYVLDDPVNAIDSDGTSIFRVSPGQFQREIRKNFAKKKVRSCPLRSAKNPKVPKNKPPVPGNPLNWINISMHGFFR